MGMNPEFWTDLLRRITNDVMGWLPALAAALGLLLLGWVVARLIQAFLGGVLRRLGLDRLAEKAGATRVLAGAGVAAPISRLVARIGFWIVMLVFVLAAAESLGLQGLAGTMGGLVAYLPRLVAAAFIVLVGSLLARLIGDGVGTLAAQSDARSGPLLGQAVRMLLLAFVVILALDQVGVSTQLLTGIAIALTAGLALALAVAFGWGSRVLAHNIMSGFHAKDEFTPGASLRVREHSGRLVSIGAVKTVIETHEGRVSLPNSVLTDEEVAVIPDSRDSA